MICDLAHKRRVSQILDAWGCRLVEQEITREGCLVSLLIRAGGHKRGLSVELVHSHSVLTIFLFI